MKNWKTTLIGLAEATLLGVSAEMLLDLTWQQRGIMLGVAFLRALFAFLAADAKAAK